MLIFYRHPYVATVSNYCFPSVYFFIHRSETTRPFFATFSGIVYSRVVCQFIFLQRNYLNFGITAFVNCPGGCRIFTSRVNYYWVSSIEFENSKIKSENPTSLMMQPDLRLQSSRAVGIGMACWFRTGKQLDASRTVGVSKASLNRDCVASGHLGPSQIYGQARGSNAVRFAWSQCRVRLCRSWYPVDTAGAHIWHRWISTQLDKILPLGLDAASDIPRTAVRRHEIDLRCPTRFRAWTTSILSVHGRIAGYHQEGLKEDVKAHSYADDTQVHLRTGASNARTAVRRFVSCTEKI